ncbi:MAG: hypothetical protein QM758_22085 [Armatimonas sp.]
MSSPTLTLAKTIPDAMKHTPVLILHKVLWTLRADYPAPHGTVYLRFSVQESGEDCLDIITSQGRILQRLMDTPFSLRVPPRKLQAGWLALGRTTAPLLRWEQLPPGENYPAPYFLAFPDGFAGLCTLSEAYERKTTYAWNGIRFVEAKQKNEPDVTICSEPRIFPKSKSSMGAQTRFAAAIYGGRRYMLRWGQTGMRYWFEVLDSKGKRLALHWLKDDLAGTSRSTLGAMWLDEKRHEGLVLEARDSDLVRLYVFTDDFGKLLCTQSFDDSSSSIAATTVSFDRDKRGLLTVSESYSERPDEEGHGGTSSETNYVWDGHSFVSREKG